MTFVMCFLGLLRHHFKLRNSKRLLRNCFISLVTIRYLFDNIKIVLFVCYYVTYSLYYVIILVVYNLSLRARAIAYSATTVFPADVWAATKTESCLSRHRTARFWK